jgi:phosphatidylglycerol:prolipoprotein diacylglycerol transferase
VYPFIHLADGLEIPSFFLVISLVLSISLAWISRRSRAFEVSSAKVLDLSLVLMVASLMGSRLFHVFYENPDYYLADPKKVFYLWDGGFVFFGGAFLAFAASLIFFKWAGIKNRAVYFDLFAPVLAFSYGFGRLGCFLAGCCYGRTCDVAKIPWALGGRHPTQLYALFWELGVLLILLGTENIPRGRRPSWLRREGDIFVLWVGLHAAGRLMMEHFRDDFRGNDVFGLSISSFFSVLLLVSVGLLFVRKRALHGKI